MGLLFDLLIIIYTIKAFMKVSSSHRHSSIYINLIILSSVTGLTYGPSYDYDNYKLGFNNLMIGKLPESEVGFYYLNVIIKSMTDNFNIAYVIYMIVINLCILLLIYKYSENIDASILIYLILGGYGTATNITRQFIALGIVTYSLKLLLNKKYIMFVLLGILGCSMHTSAFIPIVSSIIIKLFNKKLNKNLLIYFIVVNMIIIIEPLIRQIGIELFYENYTHDMYNYSSNILHYIVQVSIFIFYYINRNSELDESNKFFINYTVLASMFTLLSRNMVLYARFSLYFNTLHCICLVNIINNAKDDIKKKRLFVFIISIGLIIYYVLLGRYSLANQGNSIIDFFKNLIWNFN